MRIAHLKATAFALPLRAPLHLAGGPLTQRCGVLVEIADAAGQRGWGEAALPVEATPAAVRRIAAQLAPRPARVIELDADGTAAQTPPLLRGAVEMAALDLAARQVGDSVAARLGAVQRSVIPLNALIGRLPPEETAAAAADAVAAGYPCLKIKIDPHDSRRALETLRAVRAAVGASVALRVDVNAGWDVDTAADFLARCEVLRLEYVEQPVATLAEMSRLRARVAVPLAADETIDGPDSVRAVAAARAADAVVIKPTRIGLRRAAAALTAARETGLTAVLSSHLDSGVGIAAALQLAALLPAPTACGLSTGALWQRDLVVAPPLPERGLLRVPAAAGLGVEVDDSALAQLEIAA